MAFSDAEKSSIRQWMGYADIYHDADPRLENAILAVEQLNDGGAALARVQALLVQIATTWAKYTSLDCLDTAQVGNISVDPLRGRLFTAKIGRSQVGLLSDALRCRPARDIFGGPDYTPVGHPFQSADTLGGWPR